MLGFFVPVSPSGVRIKVDPADALALAMRAASASHTPLDQVLHWPWHKMLVVWSEGQEIFEETWGLLLNVYYKSEG